MTNCIETKSPALSPVETRKETTGRVTVWTLAARAVTALLVWQRRAMERHHMRRMDDRLLRDIGLSRADIESEAAKPFWRP
ncbi:DUF1127 domain-containing protein [Zavarzinia aquatilis]|uniref:YjiS-like domain-containing protein n=1 Tax=Zavarzinia aquatilis TaxID=2211142 RepID=A0A317E1Z6_9PROT|nr:DUF1127 domain-containing protein [Zavarzinia aquatilis]PWR20170.1 hypothetical protein DKG74_15920 [Zavarzinia aquatilis]